MPELKPFLPRKGWLKDGCIPARTICPFRVICSTAKKGLCHHQSQEHPKDFSCASARGYEIVVNQATSRESSTSVPTS